MAVANIRSLFILTAMYTAEIFMQEIEQYTKCSIMPLFCLIIFSIHEPKVPVRVAV
jgi:hypothetical protein